MSFGEAIKSVFSQYVGFNGRARRSEYWYFVLLNVIVSAVVNVLTAVTGLAFLGILGGIYSFVVLLPGLAVCIRRLHDIGKSGWFLFLGLIPVAGAIILLVFCCQDSQPGDNQYGPNPKA